MDDEMIDRVAKALYEDDPLGRGYRGLWQAYVPQAKVTIKAMRDPTEKMINIEELPYSPGEMKEFWQAMIDAVIND